MFCELGSLKVLRTSLESLSLSLDEMAPLRSEATPKSGRVGESVPRGWFTRFKTRR